jgi:hypothetical protein
MTLRPQTGLGMVSRRYREELGGVVIDLLRGACSNGAFQGDGPTTTL